MMSKDIFLILLQISPDCIYWRYINNKRETKINILGELFIKCLIYNIIIIYNNKKISKIKKYNISKILYSQHFQNFKTWILMMWAHFNNVNILYFTGQTLFK